MSQPPYSTDNFDDEPIDTVESFQRTQVQIDALIRKHENAPDLIRHLAGARLEVVAMIESLETEVPMDC